MENLNTDYITGQKLTEFIGSFNMVLRLKGHWYEIPFETLWAECVIDRKTNPREAATSLESYLLIDMATNEILSRWPYFEHRLRRMRVEHSKLNRRNH